MNDERERVRNELHLLANALANYVNNGEDAPEYMWKRARELQAWLKEHPASSIVEVDTDDLTPETRAEVEAIATPVVTGLDADRAVLKELRDQFDAAWEARIVAASDFTDIESRNDTLDRLDARMRELKDEMAIWEACVSIASLDEATDNEGGTP